MEPNTVQAPAEKEFSTYECLKGVVLYFYRIVILDPISKLFGNFLELWKATITRFDLFAADKNPEQIKGLEFFYGLEIFGIECIAISICLGYMFNHWVGVIWFLQSCGVRLIQGVYYMHDNPEYDPEYDPYDDSSSALFVNSPSYTFLGAIINTRQIFADNWNWLKKIGADELKQRAANTNS